MNGKKVGITGDTATEVAQTICAQAEGWDRLCDGVEQTRMRAKAAVSAATDLAGVAAAEAAIVWPAA